MNTHKIRDILFVVNPASGGDQEKDLKDSIAASCRKHHIRPRFFETTGHDDDEKIKEAISASDPYGVVAVGGDGTVNLIASLLIDTPIKLGIIPTGSANGMAFELNIPTRIDKAIALIGEDVSERIDMLRINKSHLAVHLTDLGMNARIIKRFDEEDIRGFYGYARQFFKEFKGHSHFRCIIECDGEQPQYKYKAVMIAMLNTHFFGTGAMVNPTGKINDGQFEIVIIKPYPWYYIFHMLVAFFTGNIHRLRHVRILSCQQAKIKLQSAQDLQIDGEPIGMVKRVDIEVLPRAIEVFCNQRQDHFFLKSEDQGL